MGFVVRARIEYLTGWLPALSGVRATSKVGGPEDGPVIGKVEAIPGGVHVARVERIRRDGFLVVDGRWIGVEDELLDGPPALPSVRRFRHQHATALHGEIERERCEVNVSGRSKAHPWVARSVEVAAVFRRAAATAAEGGSGTAQPGFARVSRV